MPTCWGYARRSTEYEEQAESLSRQCAKIPEKFAKIKEDFPNLVFGRIFSETGSATTIPFDERPECVKLFKEMKKGDHLIVENLQRLDRGGLRQVKCLEELRAKGIHLWEIDSPLFPNGVPLDTAQGQLLILACSMQTVMWGHAQSEGRKRCYAAKKARNEPASPYPPIGFQWSEDEQGRSMWIPDIAAQELIREVVLRRHGAWHGSPGLRESWAEIGYDMLRRNATIAGIRGKTNNPGSVQRDTPKLRRKLARVSQRCDKPCMHLHTDVMQKCYRQYRQDLLDGFEFKMPIADVIRANPGRKEEIEWLLEAFKTHDPEVKPRKKRRHLEKFA